jgi:hypothetical protein
METCLPCGKPRDPVWYEPVHAAALIAPTALDSCFMLMDKLATATGSSRTPQYGKGRSTISSPVLVRPLLSVPQSQSQSQSQSSHSPALARPLLSVPLQSQSQSQS